MRPFTYLHGADTRVQHGCQGTFGSLPHTSDLDRTQRCLCGESRTSMPSGRSLGRAGSSTEREADMPPVPFAMDSSPSSCTRTTHWPYSTPTILPEDQSQTASVCFAERLRREAVVSRRRRASLCILAVTKQSCSSSASYSADWGTILPGDA